MKYLIRIAIGAAIAGALISLLMKRRSGESTENPGDELIEADGREGLGRGTGSGFTVEELIADTPAGQTLNS